jgi:multiple sugar transport system ATP-binding protein
MLVTAADGEFRGHIYSVELIGDHSLVTLNVGQQQMVVKVSNMFTGEIGAEVGLRASRERVYFFDQSSGLRIRQC